jgi:hypothetical protein
VGASNNQGGCSSTATPLPSPLPFTAYPQALSVLPWQQCHDVTNRPTCESCPYVYTTRIPRTHTSLTVNNTDPHPPLQNEWTRRAPHQRRNYARRPCDGHSHYCRHRAAQALCEHSRRKAAASRYVPVHFPLSHCICTQTNSPSQALHAQILLRPYRHPKARPPTTGPRNIPTSLSSSSTVTSSTGTTTAFYGLKTHSWGSIVWASASSSRPSPSSSSTSTSHGRRAPHGFPIPSSASTSSKSIAQSTAATQVPTTTRGASCPRSSRRFLQSMPMDATT